MKQLKLFIILIFILIMVQGCANNKEVLSPNSMTPPSIDITETENTINIYNFSIEKETTLPSFVKLINDRYGIELKFHDAPKSTESSVISELDGLLYCYTDSISEFMKNKTDKYYTLNEFLKDNEVFNLLPKQYRNSIEDQNGDIWYLPTQQVFFLDRRVYDEEIMNNHDYSVPSTVDELLKLLSNVRANDNHIKLLTATLENCLWEFKDILESYGLTVFGTKDNNGIIGWNEETQRFEDTINNLDVDAFLDTIDYMRTNSLYEIGKNGSDTAINTARVFTKMTTSNRKTNYMSEPFYDHKEYIFSYKSNSILVPLGTTNPKASLNLFINTFFGSNEGNIYGYHGESGRTVEYDDSFSQVDFLPSNKLVFNEDGSMYFIGLVGPWLNNDYVHWSPKLDAETNERNKLEWSDFNEMFIQKLVNDEIEVLAPYKNLYDDQNTTITPYSNLFKVVFFKYLNQEIDRDSFVEEYISEIKKAGAEDYINELNRKIGADSMFYYN